MRFVKAAIHYDFNLTRRGGGVSSQDICKSIGLNVGSWQAWKRDKNFCQWYDAIVEHHFRKCLPSLYKTLLESVLTKDKVQVDAVRLFMERFDEGYKPQTKQEVVSKNEHFIGRADQQIHDRLANIMEVHQQRPVLECEAANERDPGQPADAGRPDDCVQPGV